MILAVADDCNVMAHLADGGWIARQENQLISGHTGLGKIWIAFALGHKACHDGRPVLYQRAARMFEALALARSDGRHERILITIARMEVLIIDDRGLAVLTAPQGRDLLEILEDRHGRATTIVTSQLPVEHWHVTIRDPNDFVFRWNRRHHTRIALDRLLGIGMDLGPATYGDFVDQRA